MDTRRNAGGPPRGLEERLFEARTLMISGEINQKLAESISLRLLALSAASSAPINLFINSQGGHVEAGDTIHDMIRFVAPRASCERPPLTCAIFWRVERTDCVR